MAGRKCMNRREARKNAFYLVFHIDFHQQEDFDEIKTLFLEQQEKPIQETAFILKEAEGTKTHLAEIDDMISKNLKGWAKERISKIDLAILRLAIYEICFSQEIPPGVAVNEAVELAKEFSTEEAPAFINGVLGSIIKKVQ